MADVVLIHAGIADARMWAPQQRSFAPARRVLAPDLPGFGTEPYDSDVVDYRASVRDAMDTGGMQRAALVGTSLGGTVALGIALESPERVSALVLVDAGIDDHERSSELEELDALETEAFEQGDFDAAADSQLVWVTGPGRSRAAVDPEILDLVATMQRNVYELQEGYDDIVMRRLDPPASRRLGEIRVPTLVVTGGEDFEDFQRIGDRLAAEIPGARRVTIAAAGHLPSLEQPEEFDRVVLGFLDEHGV
jgi:pimeloyl-ACP methyl ester carboxylesterase